MCLKSGYRIKPLTQETKSESAVNKLYEYDAFVSYSSDDDFWVHDVLMKTLEEIHGFRLVIHYRDILLGQNIGRAISDRIENSREFILVMTQNFLDSEWCQREMEEAYHEALMRHGRIAVIVLGNLPTQIRNPTARIILERYNYLQWKIHQRGHIDEKMAEQKLFWAKLIDHLYGNQSECCSCFRFWN